MGNIRRQWVSSTLFRCLFRTVA